MVPTPLQSLPPPATPKELNELDAPFARIRDEHGPCVLLGKIVGYTPLFEIVAFAEFGQVITQRCKADRVHWSPCSRCPDHSPFA